MNAMIFPLLLSLLAIPGLSASEGNTTVGLSSLDLSNVRQGWGRPHADLSVEGHPLSVGQKQYAKGLGTHAPGEVFVKLARGSKSFHAAVGVDDEVGIGKGTVEFVVLGDGKLLWRSGLMKGGDPAKSVDIDTRGVDTLILRVTDGGDGNSYDHADWCEATFDVTGTAPEIVAPPPPPDHRWELKKDAGISWDVAEDTHLPHEDQLEMSGRMVSVIVSYGVDFDGRTSISRHVVWPTLRTVPNDTHGSLSRDFGPEITPRITVNGRVVESSKVQSVEFDGVLSIRSLASPGLEITRSIFPTTTHRAVMEKWTLKNVSPDPIDLTVDPIHHEERTDPAAGVDGVYVLTVDCDGHGPAKLAPGHELTFAVPISGRKAEEPARNLDASTEEKKRRQFVRTINASLRLETPDPILNRAFDFAKLRAAESIFQTKNGLMHSPGGGPYYAALWCNDQAEYAGPFFPFLGDSGGNDASLNCYRLFATYMHDDYKPIPSSIIAEGTGTWEGAGDRGDAAMYAYGASRFALARGNREIAEELWKPITWALEYCRRQQTVDGVIASDSDELEGRFPAGKANLATSCLTFAALRSAADLGRSLGKPQSTIADLEARADTLRNAIESYFGADVEGYHTYRYYAGNTVLRSWICLPLTMGIMDRKAGTIDALFSPSLWTADGLATQAGDTTFWDRSTLYGFRGVFDAGETDKGLDYLTAYTKRRLTGEHVPYAVEAYPEGNQRHLSGESALYCRVYTEGLFGITPTGLKSFRAVPRLPTHWDRMALRSIKAFGHDFDLTVEREGTRQKVSVLIGGATVFTKTCDIGDSVLVVLP